MTLYLNGTTGVSGVDGSAGTPAIQGTDTNTGISFGSDVIIGSTGGTERFRVDASGRLLVGTSSAYGLPCQFMVQGYDGNSTNVPAIMQLVRSDTDIVSGDELGQIRFSGSETGTGGQGVYITGEADGTWTGSSFPSRLKFSTCSDGSASPQERMRIKSNGLTEFANDGTIVGGNAYIFRSTLNDDTFFVRNTNASFSNNIVRIGATRNTSNGTYNFFNCVREGVDNVLYIRDSGNVVNTNNSYGAISDIKLKENIVDANSQWDDIRALQVRKYNFKEGQTHTQIGLVAQEAELVSPGLVSESPDRDDEGNDLGTVTKSVNYSVLYMKAVKALQEAMERIEQLEAAKAAQQTVLDDLLARVTALETP